MKKTRHGISIDSELYKEFSEYAKKRGFKIIQLLRYAMKYCINNDLAVSKIIESKNNGKNN